MSVHARRFGNDRFAGRVNRFTGYNSGKITESDIEITDEARKKVDEQEARERRERIQKGLKDAGLI